MSLHRSVLSPKSLMPVLAVVACLLVAATGRGQVPYRLPPLPQSGPGAMGQAKAARREMADDASGPVEPAIAAVSASSPADDQVAPAPYPTVAAAYPESSPAQPAEPASLPSYAELSRRLQALEARVNDGATGKDAAKDLGGCKEVPIQTAPTMKLRGQMFFDCLGVESTPLSGPLENFTGFRDLRLGVEGNVWENLKYVLEVQFNPIRNLPSAASPVPFNEVRLKDVYGEFSQLPWVDYLRIGHYKEPDGLEQNVSDKYTTFMERSEATTVFTPARKDGLMIYDAVGEAQNFGWFVGMFRGDTTDDDLGSFDNSDDLSVTGRAVWLPYFDEATPGHGVVHLGGAIRSGHTASAQEGNGDMRPLFELDGYRTGLRARLAPNEEFMQYGTELAIARGSFSLQNEFFFLATGSGSNVRTWGTYVEASYFLTGENRSYNKVMKIFGRVDPYEPFFAVRTDDGVCRGWGAWQVAARWSYVDLNTDGTLQPGSRLGSQSNVTLGLNWYLNPYSRVMFNYVHAVTSPMGGAANQLADDVGVRFQVDW